MSDSRDAAAVIFVSEVPRVSAFYEKLLGMTVVHADELHAVLDSGHFQLTIHALPAKIAESILIESPPQRREDTHIKLCFGVPSIAAARAAAPGLGGVIDPPSREWEARGFRACDGTDPEGNVIQVRETVR